MGNLWFLSHCNLFFRIRLIFPDIQKIQILKNDIL